MTAKSPGAGDPHKEEKELRKLASRLVHERSTMHLVEAWQALKLAWQAAQDIRSQSDDLYIYTEVTREYLQKLRNLIKFYVPKAVLDIMADMELN